MAVGLRGYHLGDGLLWVDEAETAINALTIVADGVPGDRFLGLPLYENTLVRPWPGHPEYEFKDLSYSDKGLAVYHSWIPLYAVAAAFRLAGVTPDMARRGSPVQDASRQSIERWTIVPRLPAVVFGVIFVVAAWALGRALSGPPAGLAFGFAAAAANYLVDAGRQARYYSAALAGNTVCALAIWRAWHRGRLVDHALVGLAIGVLFHIHSVSAVAMTTVYVACVPLGRRQPQLLARLSLAAAVSGALILPWAAWSGLLAQTDRYPASRDFASVRMLLAMFPTSNALVLITTLVCLGWFLLAAQGRYLPERWRRPILDCGSSLYFLTVWLLVSYASFVALMPAASFAVYRLKLLVAVPGLLILTLFVSALSRVIRPHAALLPFAGMVLLLALTGQVPPHAPAPDDGTFASLIEHVRAVQLGERGRVYASPNEQLTLMYYSGKPIQSVAAVRKTWLDGFEDDLIIIEGPRYKPVSPRDVQRLAATFGLRLSDDDAVRRVQESAARLTVRDLESASSSLPTVGLSSFDRALDVLVQSTTQELVEGTGTLVTLDREIKTFHGFRMAFFYWLSNPEARDGQGLNYRRCVDRARITVHPSLYTVLDCRRAVVQQEPNLAASGARP